MSAAVGAPDAEPGAQVRWKMEVEVRAEERQ